VALIEMDFDLALMAVDRGHGRQQFWPIPRDTMTRQDTIGLVPDRGAGKRPMPQRAVKHDTLRQPRGEGKQKRSGRRTRPAYLGLGRAELADVSVATGSRREQEHGPASMVPRV
jgi:hypothetical protein